MRARHFGAFAVLTAASLVVATVSGASDVADPVSVVAVRVQPPGRTVAVVAVGDFLAEGLVNSAAHAAARQGVRFDYEPLLRPLTSVVQWADLAICHMETPITGPGGAVGFAGDGPYGIHLVAAAWETPFDLRRLGFDRCSTASNHANDLGTDGISVTLDALDAAGLGHSGTARSPQEAAVTTFVVNGVRMAHLSYARNSNTGFPADEWRIATALTPDTVIADVAAARAAGAELVIVSMHVYVEMLPAPTAEDRALVTAIIDAAHPDLVVVHGPHVPQPVERVSGTPVYWSLGNFISGMGAAGRGKYSDVRTLDGLLAAVRFTQQPNGAWTSETSNVVLCTVPGSRTVYAGVSALQDPSLGSVLRGQLVACVNRTSTVVGDLR
jgi:poly-gamma-glutamate synthesis protein (capsule biosynthesis protein)